MGTPPRELQLQWDREFGEAIEAGMPREEARNFLAAKYRMYQSTQPRPIEPTAPRLPTAEMSVEQADPEGARAANLAPLRQAIEKRLDAEGAPFGGVPQSLELVANEYGATPATSPSTFGEMARYAVEPDVYRPPLTQRAMDLAGAGAAVLGPGLQPRDPRTWGEWVRNLATGEGPGPPAPVPDPRTNEEKIKDALWYWSNPRMVETAVRRGAGVARALGVPVPEEALPSTMPSAPTVEGLYGLERTSPEMRALEVVGGAIMTPAQELLMAAPTVRAAALPRVAALQALGHTARKLGELADPTLEGWRTSLEEKRGAIRETQAALSRGTPDPGEQYVDTLAAIGATAHELAIDAANWGLSQLQSFKDIETAGVDQQMADTWAHPFEVVPQEQAVFGTTMDARLPRPDWEGRTPMERWALASAERVHEGGSAMLEFPKFSRVLFGDDAVGMQTLFGLGGLGVEFGWNVESALLKGVTGAARFARVRRTLNRFALPGTDLRESGPAQLIEIVSGPVDPVVARMDEVNYRLSRDALTVSDLPLSLREEVFTRASLKGLLDPDGSPTAWRFFNSEPRPLALGEAPAGARLSQPTTSTGPVAEFALPEAPPGAQLSLPTSQTRAPYQSQFPRPAAPGAAGRPRAPQTGTRSPRAAMDPQRALTERAVVDDLTGQGAVGPGIPVKGKRPTLEQWQREGWVEYPTIRDVESGYKEGINRSAIAKKAREETGQELTRAESLAAQHLHWRGSWYVATQRALGTIGPDEVAAEAYQIYSRVSGGEAIGKPMSLERAFRVAAGRGDRDLAIYREYGHTRRLVAHWDEKQTKLTVDHKQVAPAEELVIGELHRKGIGIVDELPKGTVKDPSGLPDPTDWLRRQWYRFTAHGRPPLETAPPRLTREQAELSRVIEEAMRSQMSALAGPEQYRALAGGRAWLPEREHRQVRATVRQQMDEAGLDLQGWTGDAPDPAQVDALAAFGARYGRSPVDPANPTIDDLNEAVSAAELYHAGTAAHAVNQWAAQPADWVDELLDVVAQPLRAAHRAMARAPFGEGLFGVEMELVPKVARARAQGLVRKIEQAPVLMASEMRQMRAAAERAGEVWDGRRALWELTGATPPTPEQVAIARRVYADAFTGGAPPERLAMLAQRIRPPKRVDRYAGLWSQDPAHQADAIQQWAVDHLAGQQSYVRTALASLYPGAAPSRIEATLQELGEDGVAAAWHAWTRGGGDLDRLVKAAGVDLGAPIRPDTALRAWAVQLRQRKLLAEGLIDLYQNGLAVRMPKDTAQAMERMARGVDQFRRADGSLVYTESLDSMLDLQGLLARYGVRPGKGKVPFEGTTAVRPEYHHFTRDPRWDPQDAVRLLQEEGLDALVKVGVPTPVLDQLNRALDAGKGLAQYERFEKVTQLGLAQGWRAKSNAFARLLVDSWEQISRFGTGRIVGNWGLVSLLRIDHPLQTWAAIPVAASQMEGFGAYFRTQAAARAHNDLVQTLIARTGRWSDGGIFPGQTLDTRAVVLGDRVWTPDALTKAIVEQGADVSKYGATIGADMLRDVATHESWFTRMPRGLIRELFTPRRMLQWGEEIEQRFRYSAFIDRLRQGESVEEAGRYARNILMNYVDLSPWDRFWLRRSLGFWAFGRTNLNAFWRVALTDPSRVGRWLRFARDQGTVWGHTELENKARSKYDLSAFIVARWSTDPDDRTKSAKLWRTGAAINPVDALLLSQGLANAAEVANRQGPVAGLGGAGQAFVENAHPALRGLLEATTERDLTRPGQPSLYTPLQNKVPSWMARTMPFLYAGKQPVASSDYATGMLADEPSVWVVGEHAPSLDARRQAQRTWRFFRPYFHAWNTKWEAVDMMGAYRFTDGTRPPSQSEMDQVAKLMGLRVALVPSEGATTGRRVRAEGARIREQTETEPK